MRKIDKVIIHCTATPEGREVTVKEIDMWHRARGFRKIGYHYVVHLDGRVEEGRPVREIGAHCKGENAHSIGVCYVGGLERGTLKPKDTRTGAQRFALRRLVEDLKGEYPGITVHGHREYAAKSCPCFDVRDL